MTLVFDRDDPARLNAPFFFKPEFAQVDDLDLGERLGLGPAPRLGARNVRNSLVAGLSTFAWENPSRPIAYPRDRNAYTELRWDYGQLASYTYTIDALQRLMAAGFVADIRRTRPAQGAAFRSTLCVTPKFIENIGFNGITELMHVPGRLLSVRDENKRSMKYRNDSLTNDLNRDLEEINESTSALQISISHQS